MIAAAESERELLAAILLGRADWTDVAQHLTLEDWSHPHRAIVAAMFDLQAAGQPWDGVSVLQCLLGPARATTGELMAGARLLAKPAQWHIDAIASAARRRRLVAECERLAQLAEETTDADAAISEAQSAMLALMGTATTDAPVSVSAAAGEWIDELGRRMDRHGDILGTCTPWLDLDRLTGGFEPGQLIVIAGRPAMGKTTLAMNIAEHAMLRSAQSVLVFSLEMGRQELVGRLAASMASVDMGKFRNPHHLDAEEWSALTTALAAAQGKPMWIDDASALHIHQIRARAKAHAQRRGCQLIVVDYVGLVRADSQKPYEAVTQVSGGLKALAKDLGVPVIAVAQLNRDVDKRGSHRPAMADLRDSGALEQDADKVLMVWRPEVYEPDNAMVAGKAEVALVKNRSGETGVVELEFQGRYNRFVEVRGG